MVKYVTGMNIPCARPCTFINLTDIIQPDTTKYNWNIILILTKENNI